MSGKICAVSSCKNFELLKLSKSFFRFPRDKTVCGQWVRKCMRTDLEDIYKEEDTAYFNNTYRICSDHFKSTDFRNPQLYSQGLKPNTVPSQNLPSCSVQGFLASRRGNSRKRKREEEEVEHNGTSPSTSSAHEQPTGCLPDASVGNEVKCKKEPTIPELLTEIPYELKYSPEMDAPPHPLCSVTIKGEPGETDIDLPFKISLKTEEIDCKETILQEMVPEFPMELKYSPPVDLSAQPFCSATVKSEPEELDTDLSFKTLPKLEVDDFKTETPDDIIDGNSNSGTSPNCASYSLPSSTGGVREILPIENLSTLKDEVIAPYLCTRCPSSFRKECQLRSHLHSHHRPEDDGFSCFVCNKMYVKRAEFMRHVLELHPRLCPVCRETFHSWWDLHEHLSKYSELHSYSSPRCSQVYPTSTALEQPVHIYIFKTLG